MPRGIPSANGCARRYVSPDLPCRVRNVDTKEKIVEIAHFSRVTEAYQFTKNGPDFRNKEPISELDIRIAVRIAYE